MTGVIVFTLVHYAASLVIVVQYISDEEQQFAEEMRQRALAAGKHLALSQMLI